MKKGIGKLWLIYTLLVITGCTAENTDKDLQPSDYVNPFIGASTSTRDAGVYHGLGKTFPGATTPFGMVQVSPNTITGGDNSPGYSYEHKTIEGFAFTQMSGVGWYVFRSQFPLQTVINPQMVNDELNSLITLAGQSGRGYYERWELLNSYSGCMIGNPALYSGR